MEAEQKEKVLERLKEKYKGELPFDIGWLSEGTLLGNLVDSVEEVLSEVAQKEPDWESLRGKRLDKKLTSWDEAPKEEKEEKKATLKIGAKVHFIGRKNITGVILDKSDIGFNHWMVRWDRTWETVREYGNDLVAESSEL